MAYLSSALRWSCARDGCHIDQTHEIEMWDRMNAECYDRGIKPTDIDGLVEVNGSFLVLEQKGRKALWDSTKGQGQSLVMLSCYDAITLIVFVPDYRDDGLYIHYKEYVLGRGTGWHEVKFDTFLGQLRKWFLLADTCRNNPTKRKH